MNIIKGGVTAAKGFKAAGCEAQIKYKNGKKDMALVYSEKPCVTAGTFTTNKVFAAPVKWDRNIVYNEDFAQAVVVNSGVANACTGVEGDNACAEEAKAVAKVLDVPENAVLIGSTGVIGMQLPVDRICAGIEKLAPMLDASLEAGTQAAEAIMTTDTRSKQVAVEVEVAGTKVTIGGMCKGAGMIHPNMATMLCYITTDCDIDKALLQKMTSAIVDDSFNMISVDGDTSTNDTVFVFANGMAENKEITEKDADYEAFREGLLYAKSHEWVKEEGDVVTIGLTDYAQSELGDLVFVNLPEEGDSVSVGEAFGDVESVKAVSDVYSPVSGVVCEINEELLDAPESINGAPYDAWFIKVKEVSEKEELLSPSEYEAFVASEQ